ncbi:MAG: hypothetical protein ACR2K9_01210 [Solirubrobacteraceae bacterium]
MARREMYNRPNPWRRRLGDDRAARTEAIVSFAATLVVVLVLIAMTIWFFFYATTSPSASSFL